MFDLDDPLAVGATVPGAEGLAELIVSARRVRQQAECDLFVLAGLWADAHDPASGLAGADRCRCLGAEGTPRVTEFAHDELGTLLHVSGQTAADLMADAIDVRHRLPEAWDRVRTGKLRPYMVRYLAQATRHLDGKAAMAVDDMLAPHWGVLPWRRLRTLIDATVIDVDPDAAEERAKAAEAERFVRVGQSGEHGLKLLVAKAAAGDVIFFMAMVNRLAEILASDGDLDPVDVRRSKAIGIIANPALALRLLVSHTAPDTDADADVPDRFTGCDQTSPHDPDGAAPSSRAQPSRDDRDESAGSDPGPVDGGAADPVPTDPVPTDPVPTDPEGDGHLGVALPGTGDSRSPDWLAGIDYRRLRPTVMLHVHLTDRALVGGDGCPNTVRVEDVGPVTLAQVQTFLGNPYLHVQVQPVIDPPLTAPADSYEIPHRIREATRLRHLVDTFPFGTRDARTMDFDHTVPWERGGATAVENLSPLTRHHHRAKTHGGWGKRQPDPDMIVWRSPHGWVYLVTLQGTLDLGHGSYARAVWDAADPANDHPATNRGGVELAS